MVSSDHLNALMETIITQLSQEDSGNNKNTENNKKNKPAITPSEILVILGILGGVLKVESVLVDTHQDVNIILTGSLKRKTALDKILDQVGGMSFEEVMTAILERFG